MIGNKEAHLFVSATCTLKEGKSKAILVSLKHRCCCLKRQILSFWLDGCQESSSGKTQ